MLAFRAVPAPKWVPALMVRDLPGQALSPEERRRGVHVSQDSRFLRPFQLSAPAGRLLYEGFTES